MYNGIGLQTARGSGTNGYVQTNKFFVRPRTGGKPVNDGKGFKDDQGTAGISKKPNKDILEHDRKRQIHLKLAILEDKLIDQGYSDAEIAQKLDEARVNLEAAAAASEESDAPGDSKISDTQTHQIAARKEKQMEAFRAALGLPDQQEVAEEGIIEDDPTTEAYEGRVKERREHSFLDRDSGRKKVDENVDEKVGKGKEIKNKRGGDDDVDEVKRHKKKESKKKRHDDSSDESEEHGRDRKRRSKKKTQTTLCGILQCLFFFRTRHRIRPERSWEHTKKLTETDENGRNMNHMGQSSNMATMNVLIEKKLTVTETDMSNNGVLRLPKPKIREIIRNTGLQVPQDVEIVYTNTNESYVVNLRKDCIGRGWHKLRYAIGLNLGHTIYLEWEGTKFLLSYLKK